MSVLIIVSFEQVHSKAQRSSTLTHRVFRHENTNNMMKIDALSYLSIVVAKHRFTLVKHNVKTQTMTYPMPYKKKKKLTLKKKECKEGQTYGISCNIGIFTRWIGSIAICSPGKISANVDIRNIHSLSTNNYNAQSSIVKGTECLLTRIHYAK